MKDILISVIMSTYKESPEWVGIAVQSILDQEYSTLELLIVIDDPSNVLVIGYLNKIAAQDPRVKLFFNTKNQGIVASLNYALTKCSGDYIARMDADDRSHPDRFIKQLNFLNNNKDTHLVGSYIQRIDENDLLLSVGKKPQKIKHVKRYARYSSPSVHPTWLAKKAVFEALNGYREVKHAEDYDFLLRALENNFHIQNLPEILVDYRVNSQSLTNKNSLIQQNTKIVIQKLFRDNKLASTSVGCIKKLLPDVTEKDFELSKKANDYFVKALQQRRQGNYILALSSLSCSFFAHKSQRQRFFDILIHKILINEVVRKWINL